MLSFNERPIKVQRESTVCNILLYLTTASKVVFASVLSAVGKTGNLFLCTDLPVALFSFTVQIIVMIERWISESPADSVCS